MSPPLAPSWQVVPRGPIIAFHWPGERRARVRRAVRKSDFGERAGGNRRRASLCSPGRAKATLGQGAALEVSVFLFLIVPSMVLSLFAVTRGTPGFVVTAVSVILRDLALCGLVLFFLWRNGEPRQRIGWTSQDWMRQAALGVLLFPLMFVGAAFCAWMFSKMGLSSPRSPLRSVLSIHSVFEAPLAVLLVAVVAVTEETIFRGYLFLRLGAVTGRMPWAVFLSTVIFAMGHGYEGGVGLATVGLIGLTLGLVYSATRTLVAPIVMHFLQDFIGIVVAPLLLEAIR